MQQNEGQERSGSNFNYGAYHSLEAVSVQGQVQHHALLRPDRVASLLTRRGVLVSSVGSLH